MPEYSVLGAESKEGPVGSSIRLVHVQIVVDGQNDQSSVGGLPPVR